MFINVNRAKIRQVHIHIYSAFISRVQLQPDAVFHASLSLLSIFCEVFASLLSLFCFVFVCETKESLIHFETLVKPSLIRDRVERQFERF